MREERERKRVRGSVEESDSDKQTDRQCKIEVRRVIVTERDARISRSLLRHTYVRTS